MIFNLCTGSRRREMLLALLLFQIAAFCLFANTFGNAWTYDDFPVIVDNPDIRSIQGFLQNTYPGRPLREITYMLDYSVFGLNPVGYHLQNIFWHALNAFFIWLLALELGSLKIGAWVSGLLFLAHPLNVEVVANISHRKDSLALAFCLVSLHCFVRFHKEESLRWRWLAGTITFWLVALSAKQNSAILPALFFAYELFYCPLDKQYLFNLRQWRFLYGTVFCLLCWYFYANHIANIDVESTMKMVLAKKANYSGIFNFSTYYATILRCWLFLWSKLIIPLKLAPEYSFEAATTWFKLDVVLAIATLTGIIVTILKTPKKYPLVLFGFIWFITFWLPVANLWPQVYLAADRYMYAPAAGVFIVVGFLTGHSMVKSSIYGAALAGGVILLFVVLTWRQNTVWGTPESLWGQAVRVSPNSSFALNNLGNVYLLKGEMLKAKNLYEKSTKVDPLNPTAWYNLGMLYENAGMNLKALENYRKFLNINAPDFKLQATDLKKRLPEKL